MKTILVDLGLVTNTKRGMGVYIFNLIKNLPNNNLKHNLILIISKNSSREDLIDLEYKFKNTKSVKFYHSPFHSIITEQLIIPILMVLNKSSILLSSGDSAPLLVKKRRVILLLHDLFFFKGVDLYKKNKISYKKRIGQLYRRICIRRFLSFQDISIITVSHFMQNEISNFFKIPISNIEVVPNGINFENHLLYKNKSNKCGMTLITGLDPQKNLNIFLKSLKILDQSIIAKIQEINIIGVSQENQILKYNNIYLKVNYLGYLQHTIVLDILKKSEFFVLPSLYESFGIPGLEALLNGCKVAASETGALKEVLGNCSTYFNPYDEYSIAEGITKMVNNTYQCNTTVIEQLREYDWKNSANKLVNYLNK